jgi:hypothetical protein
VLAFRTGVVAAALVLLYSVVEEEGHGDEQRDGEATEAGGRRSMSGRNTSDMRIAGPLRRR